jgi:hypothetical protein
MPVSDLSRPPDLPAPVAAIPIHTAAPLRTCFGLACPARGSCLRYLAVDYAPGGSTTQVTCRLHGIYPDYLYALPSEIPDNRGMQWFNHCRGSHDPVCRQR